MNKDLKYWLARGGQIEWRLSELYAIIEQMEKDLKECDENIKKLKNNSESQVK